MIQTKKLRKHKVSGHEPIIYSSISLVDAFERFINAKFAEGLAPRTLEDHKLFFRYFMEYVGKDMPVENATVDLLRGYIRFMLDTKGLQNSTVNIRIRPIKAFFRFCYLENMMSNPIHDRVKLLKVEEDKIESLTKMELKLLLNAIDRTSYVGLRDYAMICTLIECGLRINELVNLRKEDLDFKNQVIMVRGQVAKTRKFREVPFTPTLGKLLKSIVAEVSEFETEYLFVSYEGEQILPNTWRRRLKEYAKNAGLKPDKVRPHVLRHTFALHYILNGGDAFSLQRILGHADMSMVRKYIQMTSADLKYQHQKYSPLNEIMK